jgi:hypothetical protein
VAAAVVVAVANPDRWFPIVHGARELRDLNVGEQELFVVERAPTRAVCDAIGKNLDDTEGLALSTKC